MALVGLVRATEAFEVVGWTEECQALVLPRRELSLEVTFELTGDSTCPEERELVDELLSCEY